jgi:hypothetical protein
LDSINQQQHFERFRELVLADPGLHDQLRATPNEAAFIELALRFAAERGCEFNAAVLQTELMNRRRAWLERWI